MPRYRNQLESALVYQSPGRQTLTVTALHIEAAPNATGPAVSAEASISVTDSRIESHVALGQGVVASEACAIYMKNVWIKGFSSSIVLPDASDVKGHIAWSHFATVAAHGLFRQLLCSAAPGRRCPAWCNLARPSAGWLAWPGQPLAIDAAAAAA